MYKNLTKAQLKRVDALMAAREALTKKAAGPFSNSSDAVDAIDLVSVAAYIENGDKDA